jgi:hypothetical protein
VIRLLIAEDESVVRRGMAEQGFAIRNINSRIQLLYGPPWCLCFFRSTDGLTRARVTQPLRYS